MTILTAKKVRIDRYLYPSLPPMSRYLFVMWCNFDFFVSTHFACPSADDTGVWLPVLEVRRRQRWSKIYPFMKLIGVHLICAESRVLLSRSFEQHCRLVFQVFLVSREMALNFLDSIMTHKVM